REAHAALELAQRLLERQVAAFEARDERFEVFERFFEAAEIVPIAGSRGLFVRRHGGVRGGWKGRNGTHDGPRGSNAIRGMIRAHSIALSAQYDAVATRACG